MVSRLGKATRTVGRLVALSLHTRMSRLALIGMVGLSLWLCFVPGFNLLNYYSCLVLASAGGLWMGLAAVEDGWERRGHGLRRTFGVAAGRACLVALLCASVLLLNGLWVQNCDLGSGMLFFALSPLFTMVFASQWGVAAGTLGSKAWHGRATFVVIWCCWIGLDVLAFFNHPPIFHYNAFVGYFSGAVYDSVIQVDERLLLFRAGNLWQLALLWVAMAAGTGRPKGTLTVASWQTAGLRRWAAVGALSIAVAGWNGAAGHMGYELDRERIQTTLGGQLSNDSLTLYYDRASIGPDAAERLFEDHRFRLHQLQAVFGDPYPRHISSYVYGSKEQKRRLMGAGRTFIAKPWLSEVHLHRTAYGAGVLHHELTHVYLSQYAESWLGVPTSFGVVPKMMLIEGAAMAMEFYEGSLTQHEWSAALQRTGLAPPLEPLMNPTSFWGVNPGRGYTLAGSFIRWLLDRQGVERFKRLYRAGDFNEAYGESLGALIAQWRAFLGTVELREGTEERAITRFGRPGVLSRVCPVVLPRLEAEVAEHRRAGRYREALTLQEKVVKFDPQAPMKRLVLLELHSRLKEWTKAREVRADLAEMRGAAGGLLAHADEGLGDGMWREGRVKDALAIYRRLLKTEVSTDRRRVLWVKILVGLDADLEPVLGPYLLNPAGADALGYLQEAADEFLDRRLALYLAGRRFVFAGQLETGIKLLIASRRAAPTGVTEADELLDRETVFFLGKAFLRWGKASEALSMFRAAATRTHGDVDQRRVADWIARSQWLIDPTGRTKK